MKRILFLDDDQDLSATMRDVVETIGKGAYDVLAPMSYGELVELDGQALQTDLAILDINLGANVPSGLDAMDWLRHNNYSGHIVFLTGHGRSHPLVTQAARIAGIEILEKPLGLSRLVELISGPA